MSARSDPVSYLAQHLLAGMCKHSTRTGPCIRAKGHKTPHLSAHGLTLDEAIAEAERPA